MKEHFTREEASQFIEYHPESGMFRRKKFAQRGKTEFRGWVDHKGYLRTQVAGKSVLCHRLAWLMHYGHWPKGEIDHINGDRQDNRISNLRACTHQQNNHNQPLRTTNTSGVKGVYWHSRQRKWRGQVCLNYKIHITQGFDEIADAKAAVIELRNKLHGDFANHG
ncbi:HNH endonuclease [Pseudomonas sp. GW6]